jgi:uncharacterized protein involved in response to NO
MISEIHNISPPRFPACRHAKKKRGVVATKAAWLAGEPYRLFFLSGALFSIAGVLMWPAFFRFGLGAYPGIAHAKLMITAFIGAFILGFLGTAGPRMMAAPRLTPPELAAFFMLHLFSGISYLIGKTAAGDISFLVLLGGFVVAMKIRFVFFRKELPPPPLLLAATGLACGFAGMLMWVVPGWVSTPELWRLANLLLYQGFALAPVMGVGVFFFPRLLGGGFGEPRTPREARRLMVSMALAALVLVASFVVEAWWQRQVGLLLRAAAFVFVLSHVRWQAAPGTERVGTLGNALRFLCLPLAVTGLVISAIATHHHMAWMHLLYGTGFGLVCFIAASRVIFGHSGEVARFANHSWAARLIVAGLVIAVATRVFADFMPRIMISHYEYAAIFWALAAAGWVVWHGARFFKAE